MINKILQGLLVNPIIAEYDTADAWHVRKYANGEVEATTQRHINGTFTASGYNALYAHNFALPEKLFIEPPKIFSSASSNAGIWSTGSSGTTKDIVYFYDWKPATGSNGYALSVVAKGKWK